MKKGDEVYHKFQKKWLEEKLKGKYAAIEPDSEKAYIGENSLETLKKAKENYPDKLFYLVKIGYETAAMLRRKGF
ncbi:MAG: hypothetical protein AB1630_12385 [bacterium]